MLPRGIVIGIGLQVAAWATGWLFLRYLYAMGWFVALIISVPLFLMSPFYLMRAPAPLSLRLVLSFWIVASPAYFVGVYACERWQLRLETVLIPVEFQGKAKIVFGEPGGEAEVVGNKRLILRLAANGELHTRAAQTKFASDSLNAKRGDEREYYSLYPDGHTVRLEQPSPLEGASLQPGQIVIFGDGYSWDGSRMLTIDFYVGTRERILAELKGGK